MKKKTLFYALSFLMTLSACGGGGKSESSKEADNSGSGSSIGLTSDASNASQEYSEFVEFNGNAEINANGTMLEVNVNPKIKKAANMINDNTKTEMILLDESGNKIATLHEFGRDSNFEEALYSGDTEYDNELTFIESTDSEEKAQEIVKKAKSYKIIMPMAERIVKENKYPDWDPIGTYEIEDGNGTMYQLIIKKGGNAELINKSHESMEGYKPTKGSWSHNKEEGFVELDFFAGPFIKIGTHEYMQYPILTPDYLYYDSDAYKEDTDCVEVKKVG